MRDPLVLYSTNSLLSYRIAQKYYGEMHFVWCAPFFNYNSAPSLDVNIPPSSSPSEIYRCLYEDITRGDQHSIKIELNKAGILRGANAKERIKVITEAARLEIYAMVRRAEMADFRPLLYVIPYPPVTGLIQEVPIEERAHPFSVEYRIENLHRDLFDVIQFG